jgi:hypothetical protein
MSDWIPASEREAWSNDKKHEPRQVLTYVMTTGVRLQKMYAHAVVADARIAERDELIRELAEALREWGPPSEVGPLLARVEAYQKEQT